MTPVDARLELELTGSGSRIGRVLQMIPTEG
jgi:hypothetical protein